MDDVAVLVGQDLELDVARVLHVALEVDGPVAKGGLGLLLRLLQQRQKLALGHRQAHAAAAAACRRLDHHGEADLPRDLDRLGLVLDQAVGTGHRGHAGGLHRVARRRLVPHHADVLRARADELDAVVGADVDKGGVLREETVTRVDGVGPTGDGGRDDVRDREVRLGGRRVADADGLVGELDVEAVLVGGGVDRDGGEAELLAGADDADGDLAAVGDEDLEKEGKEQKRGRGF